MNEAPAADTDAGEALSVEFRSATKRYAGASVAAVDALSVDVPAG